MGFASDGHDYQLLSKIATNDKHGENSPYFDGWKAYDRDPFHPTKNPDGVIQMGLAENQLAFDLIRDWIMENPKASICTPEGIYQFTQIANFQDYHGLPEFTKGVANFMSKVRGGRVKFDPHRILMSGGGATGANELIMFCLADPGDAFLVPSPCYPAFVRDLCWRTGIQIIAVHCDSSNNFKITREALEEAYQKAQEDNIKVKGLIITNPSNPLGTTLDRETLKSLVTFINEKNIHLVCDEIYAATIFNSPGYISVSEIIQDMESINLDLIHVIYSLSKDLGVPGFRVGIVYSYNETVVHCGRKMSSFGSVSSQTQHLLGAMLNDDKFVDDFLKESSRRLEKRHNLFTKGLEKGTNFKVVLVDGEDETSQQNNMLVPAVGGPLIENLVEGFDRVALKRAANESWEYPIAKRRKESSFDSPNKAEQRAIKEAKIIEAEAEALQQRGKLEEIRRRQNVWFVNTGFDFKGSLQFAKGSFHSDDEVQRRRKGKAKKVLFKGESSSDVGIEKNEKNKNDVEGRHSSWQSTATRQP